MIEEWRDIKNYEESYIKRLEQENKQLKEQLNNASNNYTKYIQERDKVIDEVREYIEDSCYYPELENYSNMTSEEVKELLQILDKVKENK